MGRVKAATRLRAAARVHLSAAGQHPQQREHERIMNALLLAIPSRVYAQRKPKAQKLVALEEGPFDEQLHPRGPGGTWIRKGAFAVDRYGSLLKIQDPEPYSGEEARFRGKVKAQGALGGGVMVHPSELRPVDLKVKKIGGEDTSRKGEGRRAIGKPRELARHAVHLDGKHVADVVRYQSHSEIRGSYGNISQGVAVEKRHYRVKPGGQVSTHKMSGHASHFDAVEQVVKAHRSSREEEAKLEKEERAQQMELRRRRLQRPPGLFEVEAVEERSAAERRAARKSGQAVVTGAGTGKKPSKLPPKKTRTAARTGSRGRYDESKHPRGGKGSAAGGKFVRKGSRGPEVQAVQAAVGVKATGVFDQETVDALKKYQQARGLKVDGVAGAQTVGRMRGKRQKAGELNAADRQYLRGRGKGARRAASRGGGA